MIVKVLSAINLTACLIVYSWTIEYGRSQNCGSNFTSSTGSFTSPGYPSTYPPSQKCMWTISTSDTSSVIEITIGDFNLEQCSNCFCDVLEVYGGTDERAPRLAQLCSPQTLPFTITSASSEMYIRFSSDGTVSGRGFSVTYRSVTGACRYTLSGGGVLSWPSPNLVSYSNPTTYCSWKLVANPGYFIQVYIQDLALRSQDAVSVYSSNGSLVIAPVVAMPTDGRLPIYMLGVFGTVFLTSSNTGSSATRFTIIFTSVAQLDEPIELQCHCATAEKCDLDNGFCRGGCLDGWYGPGCQIGNVALQKPTVQYQTTAATSLPSNAVDGIMPGDGSLYSCASGGNNAWLRVILSRQKSYVILNVTVQGYNLGNDGTYFIQMSNATDAIGLYPSTHIYRCNFSQAVSCQIPEGVLGKTIQLDFWDYSRTPCEISAYGYLYKDCGDADRFGPQCLWTRCTSTTCSKLNGTCGVNKQCRFPRCPNDQHWPPECWIKMPWLTDNMIIARSHCLTIEIQLGNFVRANMDPSTAQVLVIDGDTNATATYEFSFAINKSMQISTSYYARSHAIAIRLKACSTNECYFGPMSSSLKIMNAANSSACMRAENPEAAIAGGVASSIIAVTIAALSIAAWKRRWLTGFSDKCARLQNFLRRLFPKGKQTTEDVLDNAEAIYENTQYRREVAAGKESSVPKHDANKAFSNSAYVVSDADLTPNDMYIPSPPAAGDSDRKGGNDETYASLDKKTQAAGEETYEKLAYVRPVATEAMYLKVM